MIILPLKEWNEISTTLSIEMPKSFELVSVPFFKEFYICLELGREDTIYMKLKGYQEFNHFGEYQNIGFDDSRYDYIPIKVNTATIGHE